MVLLAQEHASELPSRLVHVRDGELLALRGPKGGALGAPCLQNQLHQRLSTNKSRLKPGAKKN